MPLMEQSNKKSVLRDFVEAFIIALVVALPIKYFIASPFIVRQASMFPTFKDGDYLIVDKLTYKLSTPQRGDVVVFHPPFDASTYFIKRVIGLPGETVKVQDNKVTIINKENPDGVVLDEPYVSSIRDFATTTTIQDGNYFVLGDNRAVSSDSRNWGQLPADHISGRAILRLFPFTSMGYMPGSAKTIH